MAKKHTNAIPEATPLDDDEVSKEANGHPEAVYKKYRMSRRVKGVKGKESRMQLMGIGYFPSEAAARQAAREMLAEHLDKKIQVELA